MEERQVGAMTVQEAGRRGARSGRVKYNTEHFEFISRLGGQEVVRRFGEDYLRRIARRGGEATRDRHGVDRYVDIGRQGGIISAQRRAATGPGGTRSSLYDPVRVSQTKEILLSLGKTLVDPVPLPQTSIHEFESYKSGDQQGVQRFEDRMILYCSLLARSYYKLPLESILPKVERLIASDFVREAALSDSVPLLQKRPLRQSLTLGVFRMKQHSSKVRQKEQVIDPGIVILGRFFQANPPESPRTKKLLSVLTSKQKEVFEMVFFRGKSIEELAATFDITRQTTANHFTLAQSKLLQLIFQKEESWPVPLINLAKLDFEREFNELLCTLPTKYQDFTRLSVDEDLTNSEVAASLKMKPGSVRMMGLVLRNRIKQEYPKWISQRATRLLG